MPATIIGNPAVVTGLYQAFNGKAAGYNTYTNNLAYAAQNGPAAYAAEIGKGFANVPAATLAASVLTNVGIVNATLQDALEQIFTAYPVQARGQIVLNLVNLLTNLEGDATYGAAATSWNQLVGSNNAYSNNPTNVADSVVNAQTVTLTAGADVLTANMFNAARGFTPGGTDSVNTLNDDDILTGTGTNPTLNFTYGNDADTGDYDIMPTLNGIETLNVAYSGNQAALRLDLQDSTGIKAVNLSRIAQATATVTIDNLTSVPANLSISNSSNNTASTVQFLFAPGASDGTADETTLTLDRVNVAQVEINDSLRVPFIGVETINVVSKGGPNTIANFNIEDTEKVIITGDQNLTLGAFTNAAGSLTLIDGSAATGKLDLNINGLLNATADGTSGVNVALTVKTGKADDTIRVTDDTIGANDAIDAGEGNDTLILQSTVGSQFTPAVTGAALVKGVEALQVTRLVSAAVEAATLQVDLARIEGDQTTRLFNNGDAADGAATFRLNNMSAAEATGVTIIHSSTGNNGLTQNVIQSDVVDGVTTAGVTIAEGVNADPRFNFIFAADSDLTIAGAGLGNAVNTVANIKITDNDSESNTVALAEVARHVGTMTVDGTSTGFLNLDTTTAGANGGLYGYVTTGAAVGDQVGVLEQSLTAGQVKFVGSTFDSSAYAGSVVLRTDTARTVAGAEVPAGGQNLKFGAGNDTVIFDKVNDSHAGLSISDTVAGGEGLDTLVIDGQGVRVTLGASEWTNVSGFETIRLIGNGAAALSTLIGQNSYNLTLTNELIANNGVAGMINIVNDNDPANDAAGGLDVAGTAVESAVTIDARSLNANSHFSYNGEEGASATADRFVFADANMNGANIIDGGASSNNPLLFAGNADVLEVRNSAVVSIGDLANIKNVSTLAFSNDQAVAQTTVLELNDTIIDALVNSYHAASAAQREVLTVRTNNAADLANVSGVGLTLDVTQVTGKFQVNVSLGGLLATAAQDDIAFGLNSSGVVVTGFLIGTDNVVLSKSLFTQIGALSVAGGNLNAADFNSGAAINAATSVLAEAIIVDTASGAVYYNTDGATAGGLTLIGTLTGAGAVTVADFSIIG